MTRNLSWSEQLDSLLKATEGNVARIKQRLYPLGVSATEDLAGTWISSCHLPPQLGARAQQPWALETPTVRKRLSWAEAHSPSSLWEEVTVLQSQLQSQVQKTEALRQAVQGLLKEQKQQMYKISFLEASVKLLQRRPEGQTLCLEQRLEELRQELLDLRSQVQEQAPLKTRLGKCSTPTGHHLLETERQLLWKESEVLREEPKLLPDQLGELKMDDQHQKLLHMSEGQPTQACSWKMLEHLKCSREGKDRTLEATRTEAQDAQQEHAVRTPVHVFQHEFPLATTLTMSVPSCGSEVSLSDSDWEFLRKPSRDLQRSSLFNTEPSSSQFHPWSLEQENLFLQDRKMLLSDF